MRNGWLSRFGISTYLKVVFMGLSILLFLGFPEIAFYLVAVDKSVDRAQKSFMKRSKKGQEKRLCA